VQVTATDRARGSDRIVATLDWSPVTETTVLDPQPKTDVSPNLEIDEEVESTLENPVDDSTPLFGSA
jgi:hypothetical protein